MFLTVRPYIHTFNNFISFRLINKKSAKIFMDYMSSFKFEKLTYSKRTWIQIHKCSCCDADNMKCQQLTYTVDDPPRRCVVYCPTWQCKLLALQTYLNEIIKRDKMAFFYPPIPDGLYNIPRSNPKTITFAKMKWNNVALINRSGTGFNLHLIWEEQGVLCAKNVPLLELIKRNPILKNCTFKFRNIYEKLIPKKLLYTNPEPLVPTV